MKGMSLSLFAVEGVGGEFGTGNCVGRIASSQVVYDVNW